MGRLSTGGPGRPAHSGLALLLPGADFLHLPHRMDMLQSGFAAVGRVREMEEPESAETVSGG
ncbi:hypothetical protein GCM10022261_12040 [Brevibacterium daeguense]|uniref:Uncharacterized protein n=1 Tax=Brevibacterium daeguense TaxID=909936 RepID=A0ABP8EIB8_9MICO